MNNLLIGGAGFIGSHIAELLLKKGHKVTILDNFSRGSNENLNLLKKYKKLEIKKIDINNFKILKKYLVSNEKIYLLAALRITQTDMEVEKAFRTMVITYFKILNYLKEINKNKTIIFSSSASIYGQAENFPTIEKHHPYNNNTFYGALKLFSENMLNYFFHDSKKIKFINLRYFNVIGPKMDIHGKYTEVIIKWFKEIEEKKTITVHGKGNQILDFIDVRDVAKANDLASRANKNGSYNVCSRKGTTLIELAEFVKKTTKYKSIKINYTKGRKINNLRKRLGENKKIKINLNHKNKFTLQQSLKDTYNYWLKNK